MKHHILFSFLLMMISLSAFAQVQKPSSDMSYRKKVTMADEFMEKGDFGSAAVFYLSAFEEKPKKIDIAAKAGDAFTKIRDYANAAAMYKLLKNDTKDYPKAQYHYALALKQSGNYKEALSELETFINTYRAKDFNDMNDKVANEISGCKLAISMNNQSDINVEYLSRMINSDDQEFAPIPFVKNLLYFSSMRDGTAKIFRAERSGSGWDRPEKPEIFGSMERPHFGHGTFTPDRRAFYFTQCDRNIEGEFTCDIFIMQRMNNNKWGKPIRLPDYINKENTTSTMPFVTFVGNKEVLYFVSDREGGSGGMDIWYVTKEGTGYDFNFSLPINAGEGINTAGDEITPFYDVSDGVMYFSSNGHPGFGGFDIFQSKGILQVWEKPVNLGKPANSGADDKYYVLGGTKEYGYFISNRLEGTSKEYTDNDDIFYFEVKEIEVVIKGSITEAGNDSKLLDNVTVDLIVIEETGETNRLTTQVFNDGEYYFKLSPNREYKVEASKDGYETTFFEFETDAFSDNSEFTQDLALEKIELIVEAQPEIQPEVLPPGINHEKPDDNSSVLGSETAGINEEISGSEILPNEENGTVLPQGIEEQESQSFVENNKEENKFIHFEELTVEEKRDIFYVNDLPYINRNGERLEVDGLIEEVIPNPILPEIEPVKEIEPDREPPVKFEKEESEVAFIPEELTGEYYKIQLVAVSTYKPYKYESLNSLGAIQLEETMNSNGEEIQRVMLSSFQTLDEAKIALERIVENPRFKRAYIVKYVDGQRVKYSKIRLASFKG